jgi:hypothetical protein
MLKKIYSIVFILFSCILYSYGQSLFENNPDIVFNDEILSVKTLKSTLINYYMPYGGVFTPKDDLRALIIFASFGDPYDQRYIESWPSNSTYPNWATSENKPFYSTEAEFDNSSSDMNHRSVSKFYYDMSNPDHRFRLFVDFYPDRIIIDPNTCSRWRDANTAVFQELSSLDPEFDWSIYDTRKNFPNYINSSSIGDPDSMPDFIIICYRYTHEWKDFPFTDPICINCNGFSSLVRNSGTVSNGYTISSAGFTYITGYTDPTHMFIHETGHSLYEAPHYNGNNNVAGPFFYVPIAGWGMMSLNTFTSALGWERWILDWVPDISASGVSTDIKTSADLNANGIYTLRDYISTGDVIRVKIPSDPSENQYLWIENHQGNSIFDNNFNAPTFCSAPVPDPPRGIMAYVESISDDKAVLVNIQKGNPIRFINADGNYDFNFDPTILTPQYAYCGNVTFDFTKAQANPIGGQNIGEKIRNDYPKMDTAGNIFPPDGIIDYDDDYNIPVPGNEQSPIIVYNGNTSVDYIMGKNSAFAIGQKAGMAENPCIMNIPRYNNTNGGNRPYGMAPYYINGISFKILSINGSGDISVQIKLNDVDMNKNTRWTGTSIILQDITGNSNPDVNVLSNVTINLDKSGTPNKTTHTTAGDFINPTIFTCASNSLFKMQINSKVNISNASALILESGSTYEINDGATLTIKSGSTLQVKSGANLLIKGSGRIEVESGGYICIENGAIITLQNTLSAINLRPDYHLGVNTAVLPDPGTCISTYSQISFSGSGSVHIFEADVYVQNIIITSDKYYAGNNIYVGYDVTNPPYGNVVILNGKIIFDAQSNVILKDGIIMNPGASVEIYKK